MVYPIKGLNFDVQTLINYKTIIMNLLDALKWRYAVKRMTGVKIPAHTLDTILEATRFEYIL